MSHVKDEPGLPFIKRVMPDPTTVLAKGDFGLLSWIGASTTDWVVGAIGLLIGSGVGVGLHLRARFKRANSNAFTSPSTHQFFDELAQRVDRQAIRTAEISRFIDVLRNSLTAQFGEAQNINQVADAIAAAVRNIADSASAAGQTADATSARSVVGARAIGDLIVETRTVDETVARMAEELSQLQKQSDTIQGITHVIKGIANQTTMLALNAAIEAARAGQSGRGFDIVAREVRSLALQTAEATSQIDQMLSENHNQAESVVALMRSLTNNTQRIVEGVHGAGAILGEITDLARQSNEQVGRIVGAIQEQVKSSNEVSKAIGTMRTHLDRSQTDATVASNDGIELAELAERILGSLGNYTMGPRHDLVRMLAVNSAQIIGKLFEDAIGSNQISELALFDRHYEPIPSTNPQKFHSKFDRFTDEVLPPIQEAIIEQYSFILFAGAVDNNGYFPTHNRRYSKPLTGDYLTDLVNNRTKRVFSDRTGKRCGANKQPYLLQTYKRDTGEVIHDLSAPIYVRGKHWGGFRIGYQALPLTTDK